MFQQINENTTKLNKYSWLMHLASWSDIQYLSDDVTLTSNIALQIKTALS